MGTDIVTLYYPKPIFMKVNLKSVLLSWISYTILLSLALLVNRSLYFNDFDLKFLNASTLFNLWVQIVLLTFTGFIIYIFFKFLMGDTLRRKEKKKMFLILIFYILMVLSYLITFSLAYKKLPQQVMIDAPLMTAVVTILMGSIPYFRKNLFDLSEW